MEIDPNYNLRFITRTFVEQFKIYDPGFHTGIKAGLLVAKLDSAAVAIRLDQALKLSDDYLSLSLINIVEVMSESGKSIVLSGNRHLQQGLRFGIETLILDSVRLNLSGVNDLICASLADSLHMNWEGLRRLRTVGVLYDDGSVLLPSLSIVSVTTIVDSRVSGVRTRDQECILIKNADLPEYMRYFNPRSELLASYYLDGLKKSPPPSEERFHKIFSSQVLLQ